MFQLKDLIRSEDIAYKVGQCKAALECRCISQTHPEVFEMTFAARIGTVQLRRVLVGCARLDT